MAKSGTQTATQQRTGFEPAMPYLTDILGRAKTRVDTGVGEDLWSGPNVAALDPRLAQSFQMITNRAQQPGVQPLMNRATSTLDYLSDGRNYGNINTADDFGRVASGARGPTAADTYLTDIASGATAGQNPHLMAMLDANASRIGNRVNSAMSGAGRYGSFAHGDALTRTINETNLPILAQSYENDMGRRLSATGQIDSSRMGARGQELSALTGQTGVQGQNIANRMAGDQMRLSASQGLLGALPMMNELRYDPARRVGLIGQFNQDRAQADLEAQKQRFQEAEMMPWTQLQRYASLINPISQSGSTTTTSQPGPSPWMQGLGLGIGGLGALGSLFSGGATSAASGMASMLPMLLSDRNEKTDIKKIGESEETGLPIYSYRYLGDPKTYPKMVGPMAQDVQKIYPDAVSEIGGKLAIKPEAAGLLGAL